MVQGIVKYVESYFYHIFYEHCGIAIMQAKDPLPLQNMLLGIAVACQEEFSWLANGAGKAHSLSQWKCAWLLTFMPCAASLVGCSESSLASCKPGHRRAAAEAQSQQKSVATQAKRHSGQLEAHEKACFERRSALSKGPFLAPCGRAFC